MTIRLDTPGAARGDIKLDYESGQLRVVWRKRPESPNSIRYLSKESLAGTFTRTFSLPGKIDVGRISAEVSKGVMTIHLPHREERGGYRVMVS
jgi:HSP20 family molecular chaperone IbpA